MTGSRFVKNCRRSPIRDMATDQETMPWRKIWLLTAILPRGWA